MKKILYTFALLFLTVTMNTAFAADDQHHLITQEQQQQMTPEQALVRLEQGNQRFLENKNHEYDYSDMITKTAEQQYPFAIVLSCIDSRSIPDILFDQGIGNIFVARIAGNVISTDVLGSMEFATKITGAKLIVVMGHTNCGAIKGACEDAKLGNLTDLLQTIQPAVKTIKESEKGGFSCSSPVTIDAIAKQNVLDQMHDILTKSPVIAQLVQEKKVMIVGAMQDLATGKVDFFNAQGEPV